MTKIDVDLLRGNALDYAVGIANGWEINDTPHIYGEWFVTPLPDGCPYCHHSIEDYHPSTDWSQGGPIIESLGQHFPGFKLQQHVAGWECSSDHQDLITYSETPLIAAMRYYVAIKLGEQVTIPLHPSLRTNK